MEDHVPREPEFAREAFHAAPGGVVARDVQVDVGHALAHAGERAEEPGEPLPLEVGADEEHVRARRASRPRLPAEAEAVVDRAQRPGR